MQVESTSRAGLAAGRAPLHRPALAGFAAGATRPFPLQGSSRMGGREVKMGKAMPLFHTPSQHCWRALYPTFSAVAALVLPFQHEMIWYKSNAPVVSSVHWKYNVHAQNQRSSRDKNQGKVSVKEIPLSRRSAPLGLAPVLHLCCLSKALSCVKESTNFADMLLHNMTLVRSVVLEVNCTGMPKNSFKNARSKTDFIICKTNLGSVDLYS